MRSKRNIGPSKGISHVASDLIYAASLGGGGGRRPSLSLIAALGRAGRPVAVYGEGTVRAILEGGGLLASHACPRLGLSSERGGWQLAVDQAHSCSLQLGTSVQSIPEKFIDDVKLTRCSTGRRAAPFRPRTGSHAHSQGV